MIPPVAPDPTAAAEPSGGPRAPSENASQAAAGWGWLLLFLGLAIPTSYVFLTRHVWEDFLITFRHSKNLVDGNGLVFNPGRRVHRAFQFSAYGW